ncbi:MAG: transposase [Methanomethylophilus sp.]|jgi:transposase
MPKKFNDDFKNTIVELYKSGKGPTELAREYGVSVQSIHQWIGKTKEIKLNDETITPEDIISLMKEISRLKEENEILKKATAIFAKRN